MIRASCQHSNLSSPTQGRPHVCKVLCCTGLFWYILYVKFGVGTWAAEDVRGSASWRIHHFWGPGKPWVKGRGYARGNYLQRLFLTGDRSRLLNRSGSCAQELWKMWQQLVKANRSLVDDTPGWTPYASPVLPSSSLRSFRTRSSSGRG